MSASFYELMRYAKTGIDSPGMTHYDKMRSLAAFGANYPETTITGVPPVSFKSDGSALIAWNIAGNMVQSRTPTHANSVNPAGCGDKTANIFNKDATPSATSYYLTETGETASSGSFNISDFIAVDASSQYIAISVNVSSVSPSLCFYNSAKQFISGLKYNRLSDVPFTTPAGTAYIKMSYNKNLASDAMLTPGQAVIPYEPYGMYKIPVTCGGETNNILISEQILKIGDSADTAGSDGHLNRAIAKQILTGTESTWRITGTGRIAVRVSPSVTAIPQGASCVCTHFVGTNATTFASIGDGECSAQLVGSGSYREIGFYSTAYTTLDGFKTFVSGQYANGTPVTVWYVLASPSAETITVPGITPAKGNNTLSIGTTLQPSAVSITGNIK